MPVVKVDRDYKIPIGEFKDILKIKPLDRLNIKVEEGKIILEKLEKDSLLLLLENPAHLEDKLNIDKLEEELWAE
ncbi:MAG: hypothetical protein SBU_001084 [Candidatus Syntrophoarchaeum butanivorans]|nr:MAG: hypothetical protein SBU_001084 [Candidatus Syntrophoarchaeum butanivorans]